MNDLDHFGNGTHHSSADSYPVAIEVFFGVREDWGQARARSHGKGRRKNYDAIFIVPFLGPALGWTVMCSPGWENLVAIDWNDLPGGQGI